MLVRLLYASIVVCTCALVSAGAEETGESQDHTSRIGQIDLSWEGPETLPSEELLEFLGEWETADGEWIDPQGIAQMDIPEKNNETTVK